MDKAGAQPDTLLHTFCVPQGLMARAMAAVEKKMGDPWGLCRDSILSCCARRGW